MPGVVEKPDKKKAPKRATPRTGRYEILVTPIGRRGEPGAAASSDEFFDAAASRRIAELLINPPAPTEALRRLMQEE